MNSLPQGLAFASGYGADARLREAYLQAGRSPKNPLVELGFGGLATGASLPATQDAAISGWLPGNDAAERLRELGRWKKEGRPFRFLFAERYFEPAVEARLLLNKKHIGTPTLLLVRVQAHPAALLRPGAQVLPDGWLGDPLLNRLPVAVWFHGPVEQVRVVQSAVHGASVLVLVLQHKSPGRYSTLELSVSPGITRSGAPAVRDYLECTGTDGFVQVNGIWEPSGGLPRIHLHRGSEEVIERRLRRSFASVCEGAARAAMGGLTARNSKESYELAGHYLQACQLARKAVMPAPKD